MKPKTSSIQTSKTPKADKTKPSSSYNFLHLLKDVEESAKEPKREKKKEEPIIIQSKVEDFTKPVLDEDVFGELMQFMQPKSKEDPKNKKGGKDKLKNDKKKDKEQKTKDQNKGVKEQLKSAKITTPHKSVPKKPKIESMKQQIPDKKPISKKVEPLKKEVISEPKTLEELMKHPIQEIEVVDDEVAAFFTRYNAIQIIENPFKEEEFTEQNHFNHINEEDSDMGYDDDGFETIEKRLQEKNDPIPQAKTEISSFDQRTKNYLEKKQRKLDKLKEQSAPTFKPTINKKSELLDKKRAKAEDAVNRFDHLYDQDYINELKERKQKKCEEEEANKLKKEDLENCTFKPQINKYERGQFEDKVDISERQKVWAQNKQEKIREMQLFNQIKEVNECTFRPEITKTDFPVISKLYSK